MGKFLDWKSPQRSPNEDNRWAVKINQPDDFMSLLGRLGGLDSLAHS